MPSSNPVDNPENPLPKSNAWKPPNVLSVELSPMSIRPDLSVTAKSAHTALRSVYNDPQASETNKVRAAAAAIGYEQPKLGSILPSIGSINRTERWRVFEMWSQRRQYIIEHHDIPPAGWDDHLQRDNYVEPPESEGMPPVDVIDTPQGFKVLSNLLPKPGSQRKLGNGDSGNND